MTMIITALPSSIPPSVYLFIDAIPMLSYCAKSLIRLLSLHLDSDGYKGRDFASSELSLIDQPLCLRLGAAHVTSFVGLYKDFVSFLSQCVIWRFCFSVPYALVSLCVRALVFVCLCVVTPSVLRRLCCSLPGLLSSSEGRGGIKKTDPQQILSLSDALSPIPTVY